MSEELKEIPQPGTIIRYAAWNGVVLDVFKSGTSEKHILQIMFAKNIYKQQYAELHLYEDLKSGLLVSSDRVALMEELKRLGESAQAEVDKLIEKITASVDIPAATTHE
jgi:hypothetical protein